MFQKLAKAGQTTQALSNRLGQAVMISGAGSAVGGWVELGRTTLGSAGDTIDISSLPDKRYYMILADFIADGRLDPRLTFNADTGSNYSQRTSFNGGSDSTAVNLTSISGASRQAGGTNMFGFYYISNVSSKEKLLKHWWANTHAGAGAGTAPERTEWTAKWANTSNAIDQVTSTNADTGDFNTDSEIVVLGWSPDDEDTGGFWEELASVELTGTADTISSGTITAKKYLWIQFYQKSSGACNIQMTFNNDTGSNYARRGNNDGGSDFTSTSASSLQFQTSDTDSAHYFDMFIVNNSANEKLGISHGVTQNTAGADTSPQRKEQVHKWANTSAQITEIDIDNTDGGDYASGTILKVWGHD